MIFNLLKLYLYYVTIMIFIILNLFKYLFFSLFFIFLILPYFEQLDLFSRVKLMSMRITFFYL